MQLIGSLFRLCRPVMFLSYSFVFLVFLEGKVYVRPCGVWLARENNSSPSPLQLRVPSMRCVWSPSYPYMRKVYIRCSLCTSYWIRARASPAEEQLYDMPDRMADRWAVLNRRSSLMFYSHKCDPPTRPGFGVYVARSATLFCEELRHRRTWDN